MPQDRAAFRNVYFHNASNGVCLGGFRQNGSLTDETLIRILSDVLLIVEQGHSWDIMHRASNRIVTPSNSPVELGHYDIHSTGSIEVTNEPWVARLITHSISGREDQFRHGVRARDGKCVVSGVVNTGMQFDDWTGFQTAHVFPLENESLWIQFNYGRWITDMDGVGVSRINSVQNGLLMTSSLHSRFDQYLISINPDDGYKIVEFGPASFGVDGRVLDPVCRDPNTNNRVSDELLRWHFRQSVFANMRGVGEPIFESDFPSGSDMMATLREEKYGKERFEMEMQSRLTR